MERLHARAERVLPHPQAARGDAGMGGAVAAAGRRPAPAREPGGRRWLRRRIRLLLPEGAVMAVINAFAQDAVDRGEPLTVAAAYAQCRAAALAESVIGAIGLEIESHLVDLDHVADPVPWRRVEAIAAVVGKVAPGTAVTVEPARQIELSRPPDAGVTPAVARRRYEGTGARLALADRRLGLAYAGADPARPSPRVNPRPRSRSCASRS